MYRYLRLLFYFIHFSLMRAAEFRVDFFFRIFMDLNYYVVNIAFFKLLFSQTALLAGWTEDQVLIFVSGYLVVDALNMTFFSNNFWMLPLYINKGDLDYYLLRPVSTLFFLSFRDFAVNSFVNLVFALGIMFWAIQRYPYPLSVSQIFFYALLIINGTYLNYLLRLLTTLPVFWTHSSRGFDGIYWTFTKFMERPDRIFTGPIRLLLITILPFSLMASIPARVLFGEYSWETLANIFFVTGVFTVVVFKTWNFALKSYSSASS